MAPVEHPATDALSELRKRVHTLEQRKSRVQDVNAIKRLQRIYGYYVDNGQWDQVADLFAENGSIEMGLDGVFKGRKRVREYLYAAAGGTAGLSPTQINVHMQLMPVVTLAADGQSAKGTWRDVILTGELGGRALWGEGPYENEYVKQDGVWKLQRLRWFQTLVVPYEGGWAKHDDVNQGRYAASLAPDAPPTASYRPWPDAFIPPFHFRNTASALPPTTPAGAAYDTDSAAALARRVAALQHDADLLQAHHDIENLQRIYGYYIDKGMWTAAADLFANNGSMHIEGRGEYVGKNRVLAYLQAIGPSGAVPGRLFDNMQLQPVVSVGWDGSTAKARWRQFSQLAQHGQFHEWGLGVHENEYVQDDGVWKIRKLHFFPTMYTPYEQGWGKTMRVRSGFDPALPPDRPAAREPAPNGFVAPYHYDHPVTQATTERKYALPRSTADDATPAALDRWLSSLEMQIGRLEDVAQIENVQNIYGYYLATLEWDALTELFTDDGTIEIALRGVYVGKAAVRRNLNLYGQQGLDQGNLHNHMQFQPVIHVAADGKTAKLRSRAFSMLGQAGKNGSWMGGVYENELVKVDGVWKMKKDQVMNTYFAGYETGWKDLPQRPAPGITASNPPDRPPSFHFDMYPKNFLPPFHYNHPVTGEPVIVPGE